MKKCMLIYIVLAFLSMMNTGCSQEDMSDMLLGAPDDPREFVGVDAKILPYVNEYEAHAGIEVYGIAMSFVKQPAGRLGVCYVYTDKYEEFKEIEIDPDSWEVMNDRQRRFVVFHELEHCITKDMSHTDDVRSDGCPFSVMTSNIPSNACLEDHEEDYLFNLFH